MTNTYKSGSFGSKMNKLFGTTCLLAAMLIGISAKAQVTSYTFGQSLGTYTPITGGTVLGIPSNDDTSFPNNPIGFPFCFNGTTYTTVGINTNGWLEMNGQVMNNSYTALSTGLDNNIVSALNYDLQGDAATGDLRYQTIGTAPNRTLVVQWTNYDSYQSVLNGDVFNFQIRLSETTGQINIVYGSFIKDATFRFAQVGLRGASNADFNNLAIANGLQTWATPIAGISNAATCELNNTLTPVSGQTYTWSQPTAPAVPISATFTAITTTGMTLNWVDNSTNEANFIVQRSTDNITFTTVSTIASSSIATTGTAYSYVASSLYNATLYYWRVFATNANCGSGFLAAQQSTNPGTLCGTYTVGPTGAYTSLTAAFAAVLANGVNCPLVFDLQAAYLSTVETFPLTIPFLGNGPTSTITVRPEIGATNLSITSAATQTINFSGAQYITFDGRPGSIGTVRHLTIENTSLTGIAAQFINDAAFDGFNFCTMRGVNTSTVGGVIVFGTALTGGIGNSFNNITNCEIRDGATQPTNLVFASNFTANIFNNGNTFSNNIFHDWFSAASINTAMNISTGNTAWVINNNSFYQTASRTYTIGNLNLIVNLNSGSGTNTGAYVVTGNYFGGSAALCGGTPYTTLGATAHRLICLQLNTGIGGTNSIQGNTFRNFNFTTTSATTTTNGIWCAINTIGTNGANNTGNITPNIIGSTTVNNQIVTTTSGSGGLTIAYNNSASGAQNFSNNQIGGITANTTLPTISSSVVGIQTSSGTQSTISGNLIGSLSLNSSLINAISTGVTGGQVSGIVCSAFNSGLPGNQITNNTVMNLTNQYAGTSTAGFVRGIVTTSGINTITGNTVANLSNMSPQIGLTTVSSVIGISQTSATSGNNQTVANNTITNLVNLSLTANVNVNALIVSGTTLNQTLVYRNNIIGIGSASAGVAVLNGINIIGGTCRVYNNFVNIGVDATGASLTLSHEFNGILKNVANSATVMFNTVNIGGTGVGAGTANSNAFRRVLNPGATPSDSVYSNIFTNFRSNGASTGVHYAINLNNTTNYVANGNVFFGNGTGYVLGLITATPYTSISTWQIASAVDANSFAVNPNYLSSTNLHINNATQSVLESRAVNMNLNFDIDNQVRPGPTAVNGGGTGPDIGADEFDGTPVNVDLSVLALLNPTTSGCHTATEIVRVRIKNNATVALNMALNNVTITGSVTGPNPAAFGPLVLTSGTIAAGGTLDTTIATNYNMTAAGTYVFNATTSAALDFITSNDALAPVSIVISGGVATVIPNPNCVGSGTTLSVSGHTNGGSIQWQSSPDNLTWTNIVGATTNPYTHSPTDTTYYRIVSCGLHNSTVDTVNTIVTLPAVTVNDTICGPDTAMLSATGLGTLYWYTNPTGGTSINTGTTFNTFLMTTDTLWVENTQAFFGSGSLIPAACQPVYTSACSSADIINNFSTTGGITNISNLGTGCNGSLPTNNTFFPAQIHTTTPGSTVNFAVQSGATWSQGFRMWVDFNSDGDFADPGEDVWNSGTSSTALYTGSFVVPTNTASGDKRIRVMCRFATVPVTNNYCTISNSFGETEEYTLRVGVQCSAARTPVIAVVNPAPVMTVSAGSASLCGPDTTTLLTATSANTGYAYTWTPATYLSSSTGATVTYTNAAYGNFTYVTFAYDAVSTCNAYDTITLTHNPNPPVGVTASNDSVCANTPVTLVAGYAGNNPAIVGTPTATPNTSTGYPAPYGNFYWGSRHQMLVLASELSAAGLNAGYIGALSFEITNTNASQPLVNFEIKLGTTTSTAITTFQSIPMTTVFSTPSYTPTPLLNTHTFTTPFYWDGVSNIIVETCHNNTSFTTNCSFRQYATSFASTVVFRADAAGVCSNNAVTFTFNQRPIMRFWATTGSWNYVWTGASALSAPTSDTTITSPVTSGYYYVSATDSITGCVGTDSVYIYVKPTPMPNLGADTTICDNQPLLLDVTYLNGTYLWSDSTVNATYNVSAFGNYSVVVTDSISGCTGTDTTLIGVNFAPVFSLGSDITVCAGSQVTFSGPGGPYFYDWSNGDSTITTTTGIAASYDLLLTDSTSGCFNMDTIALFVNPLPPTALGNDSAICSATAPITLMGPVGNYTYVWQDNSTNSTFDVITTGSYHVVVTDTATTCFSSDTVIMTVNATPTVVLGLDSTQCGGSILLDAGLTADAMYVWQDNSAAQTFTASTSGLYYVTVSDSLTGCAASDSVNVTINAIPVVNLGADSAQCGGTILLDAGTLVNGQYAWQDASSNQTYTATTSGLYYVNVMDSTTGCNSSDSVNVTINSNPTVTFSIAQTTICVDDAILNLVGSPVGGVFSGSTGISGTTFNPAVAGAGSYTIVYDFTDVNGCQGTASDAITVSPCVGVDETVVSAGVNIFPNPNNGMFTLTIKDASYTEVTVEIMTAEGQLIYSDMASNVQGDYVKQLDLTTYANGIYFVRVSGNGQTSMHKVIKND
jgi:GEVED domain/Secretion system C-terminal sorting domain/Ig-like domain CHU_C associated